MNNLGLGECPYSDRCIFYRCVIKWDGYTVLMDNSPNLDFLSIDPSVEALASLLPKITLFDHSVE